MFGYLFAPFAQAVIIKSPEDKNYETAEKLSQNIEGLTGICSIVVIHNTNGIERQTIATGTYFKKSGEQGYILTAAHVLSGKTIAQTLIFFLTNLKTDEIGNVLDPTKAAIATNYHIHPEFEIIRNVSSIQHTIKDIAVIEFNASSLTQEIKPISLYRGKGYKAEKLFEAIIAGYGNFGFNTLDEIDTVNGAFHKAFTYVMYESGNKNQNRRHLFYNLTYPKDRVIKVNGVETSTNNSPQFSSIEAPEPFKVHKSQGVPTGGDSGGPLLFKSNNQLQVAGVYNLRAGMWNSINHTDIQIKNNIRFWAAVPDALEWIDGITE